MMTRRTTTGPTACWLAGPSASCADGAHSCRGRAEGEISSAGRCSTSTRGTRTRASEARRDGRSCAATRARGPSTFIASDAAAPRLVRPLCGSRRRRASPKDGDGLRLLYPTCAGAVRITRGIEDRGPAVPRFRCASNEGSSRGRRDVQPALQDLGERLKPWLPWRGPVGGQTRRRRLGAGRRCRPVIDPARCWTAPSSA